MGVENARAVADNGIQNLMKSDILSIEFKKEAYYEGQICEGTIILEPKQNLVMNDILIRFKQTEYFYYVADEKNVISEINNQVFFEKRLNAGQYLNMGSQMISLTPGSYKFPFQFTLQKNIPPSFEYPFHNRRASLRYLFTAEVLSPYVKATTEKYVLMKARPINIPSEIKHENHVKVKNVGIVSRGSSGIALFTMANNYRINDMIPFTVDIYNEECGVQVKEIKISIKRTVTFIKNGKEYQKRTAILRRRYPTVCDKMSKNSYHYDDLQLRDNDLKEAEFNRSLNPYPFIDDLNQLMPNVQTKLIRCEYSLKATSYFDMSVLGKDRPRVEMPIYVTHQLEKEFQYEKDTNQYQGQGQQNAFKNFGQGFDQFANQGYGGQNNGYGPSQGGYGQGGFGQNNQGGYGGNNQGGFNNYGNQGQNSGSNNNNNKSGDIGKSSQFSYEAYIAKKKLNNSTADNKNSSSNNNYGSGNNSWNQGGNYGNNNNNNNSYNYGFGNNNNNSNPYGNNNNSNPFGNNNNNNNGFGNPFGNNNSNPYANNNNNSNPYENINNNRNPYGNNNNSNPYGNNNNNNYGNNNNNSCNNPFGNNNNSPYGNNNYNAGSYGNSGTANPFGGGSNDFPSMDNLNNQKSESQAPNPFGNDNSGSNNNGPQNPFAGGNSNPYSGGYPGL